MLCTCAYLDFLRGIMYKTGPNNLQFHIVSTKKKKKKLFYISIILFWDILNTDTVLKKHWILFKHLFALLGTATDISGSAVLFQTVYCLSV